MQKPMIAIAGLCLVAGSGAASATSGPGCLRVVNVAYDDVLNVRSRPNASSRVVGELVPGEHGIIHLDRPCGPRNVAWRSRWCPVTVYDGDGSYRGWVRARFVRDSDCP